MGFFEESAKDDSSTYCNPTPLLNTEIYPFKHKYWDILAKNSEHDLYGNNPLKSYQGDSHLNIRSIKYNCILYFDISASLLRHYSGNNSISFFALTSYVPQDFCHDTTCTQQHRKLVPDLH